MRIAILHDWLEKKAGAESVLEQLLKIYPESDLFVIVDFMSSKDRYFLKSKKIYTSFVQHLPFSKKHFRKYFPLFPLAVFFFKLKKYDLIISSSHSYVKNIRTLRKGQFHLCYCYTPIRYCYDMKDEYLNDYSSNIIIKKLLNFILILIRWWDKKSNSNVDKFVAISRHIQQRIVDNYSRDSELIYPSIPFTQIILNSIAKKNYFVAISRFVPYKKIDLVIHAFNKMQDKKLIIMGNGEKFNEYKTLATSKNIIFKGWVDDTDKFKIMSSAKALVYPAFEDFGIVPVEAQACGTPVIAYGLGGVKDTVITSGSNKTGIFFNHQTTDALINAVESFEKNYSEFTALACRNNAKKFDHEIFTHKIKKLICNEIS